MIGYVLTEDVQKAESRSLPSHCTAASPSQCETNVGGSFMNDDDDDDSDHDSDISEQDDDGDDDDNNDVITSNVEKCSEAEIHSGGMCHTVVKLVG